MKKGLFTSLIFLAFCAGKIFAQEDYVLQVQSPQVEKGSAGVEGFNQSFNEELDMEQNKELEVNFEDFPFLEPVSKKELSTGVKNSSLIIDCNLKSASVFLNGIYQGKTRLRIDDLLPADYILEVKKEGYESKKFYISARSAFLQSYKIKLK